jgi:hypothetical protein
VGININGVDGSAPSRIAFDHCLIKNSIQDGIQSWSTVDVSFANCFSTANGRFGFVSPSVAPFPSFPKRLTFVGGSYSDNKGDGLFINDPSGLRLTNVTMKGNRTDATTYPTGSGITVRQVNIIPTDVVIQNCTFYDLNSTPPSTQAYGVNLIATSAVSFKLEGNYYGTQGVDQVNATGGLALIDRVFDNITGGFHYNNNLNLGAGINTRIATKTANYGITSTDSRIISNGPSLTHVLPDTTGLRDGYEVWVRNIAASNAVIRAFTGLIQGAAFIYVNQGQSVRFVYTGGAWSVDQNNAIGVTDLHAVNGNKMFVSDATTTNGPYGTGRFQGIQLVANNDSNFANQIDIDINGNIYYQNKNAGTWATPESIRSVKFNNGQSGLTLFSGSKNLTVTCNSASDFSMTLISDISTLAGQVKEIYNKGTGTVSLTIANGVTLDGVLSTTGNLIVITLRSLDWIKLVSTAVDTYTTHYLSKSTIPTPSNLTFIIV